MSSNKVVRVSYFQEDFFCIPSNINLEDASQVEDWGVKYNELNIYLTNGEHLCIEAHIGVENYEHKYPDGDSEIMDCEEAGVVIDEEKFKPIDVEKPVEKPVEKLVEKLVEEEYEVVNKIEFEGKKYLRSKKSRFCYDYDKYVMDNEQVIVGKWNNITNKIDFQI